MYALQPIDHGIKTPSQLPLTEIQPLMDTTGDVLAAVQRLLCESTFQDVRFRCDDGQVVSANRAFLVSDVQQWQLGSSTGQAGSKQQQYCRLTFLLVLPASSSSCHAPTSTTGSKV